MHTAYGCLRVTVDQVSLTEVDLVHYSPKSFECHKAIYMQIRFCTKNGLGPLLF